MSHAFVVRVLTKTRILYTHRLKYTKIKTLYGILNKSHVDFLLENHGKARPRLLLFEAAVCPSRLSKRCIKTQEKKKGTKGIGKSLAGLGRFNLGVRGLIILFSMLTYNNYNVIQYETMIRILWYLKKVSIKE